MIISITQAYGSRNWPRDRSLTSNHGPELDSQPLFDEKLCLVMADPLPQGQTALTLAQLQELRFALLAPGFAPRILVDAWCQVQRFTPNIVLEANSIAILLKVVAQGRMATILPDAIVREQIRLHEVQITLSLPGRTVALLRRKNGYQSVDTNAFVQLLSGQARSG